MNNSELEISLAALANRSRNGDKAAYGDFLRTLTPVLRRMIYHPMAAYAQQHAIEDVVQETLLTVHLKLHTYDPAYPFLAWVRVVVKHKMIDYLRRHKLKTTSIDDENFGDIVDTAHDGETETRRDLAKLLDQLKPPLGDIIYALKVDGANVRETAQKFNLSESNIKVMVHRGLQKLAELARKGETE